MVMFVYIHKACVTDIAIYIYIENGNRWTQLLLLVLL